ncbi:hypothetical protein L1887_36569 [Cichorium endivia]|nr:hypothetical protein L1887_36569 [Cichorium endivia]
MKNIIPVVVNLMVRGVNLSSILCPLRAVVEEATDHLVVIPTVRFRYLDSEWGVGFTVDRRLRFDFKSLSLSLSLSLSVQTRRLIPF